MLHLFRLNRKCWVITTEDGAVLTTAGSERLGLWRCRRIGACRASIVRSRPPGFVRDRRRARVAAPDAR